MFFFTKVFNNIYIGFRLYSLESSCDNLPTSLVLVKEEKNKCKSVVGHSKITPIPSIPDSVFVETGKLFNFVYLIQVSLLETFNHFIIKISFKNNF